VLTLFKLKYSWWRTDQESLDHYQAVTIRAVLSTLGVAV